MGVNPYENNNAFGNFSSDYHLNRTQHDHEEKRLLKEKEDITSADKHCLYSDSNAFFDIITTNTIRRIAMKKITLITVCLALVLTLTACTTRSELAESEDTAEQEISTDSLFDYSEVEKTITEYAQSHGMYEKNTLCYKSGSYYKLDTTRFSSQFELQSAYEDAVRDIVVQGNTTKAKSIYFFVEPVLTNENGNFIIYIDYEFEKGT